MERKLLISKIVQRISKHWWYILLLSISSIYLYNHRADIYRLTELNVPNIAFVLWLVLLGLPLFSEIEFGSVKLKKEIKETRTEFKETIGELKYQILEMQFNNVNAPVINIGSQPLPTKDELEELQRPIRKEQEVHDSTDTSFNVSVDSIYLFQVRLTIEKQLSALCNMLHYSGHKSPHLMAQHLMQHNVIDNYTRGLIREIFNITSRGIHGEIVDEDYIQFVKNTYPMVKKTLSLANNSYTGSNCYFECPKCHHQSFSNHSNQCPSCGFVSDND